MGMTSSGVMDDWGATEKVSKILGLTTNWLVLLSAMGMIVVDKSSSVPSSRLSRKVPGMSVLDVESLWNRFTLAIV